MIRHIVMEIIVTEEEMFHCSLEMEDTVCHAGSHRGAPGTGRESEGKTWSNLYCGFLRKDEVRKGKQT